MSIDFHDGTKRVPSDMIDVLHRLLLFASKQENIPDEAELSINFVTNQEIREINRNYRQNDRATDVISFAMQEKIEGEMAIMDEDMPLVLGDIVISIDKAHEQAKTYDHSFERELAFLTIHGFLHLLGYDHMHHEEEKIMMQKQEDILGTFGIER